MLLNWLVPQSGGLPLKYWLFHKMIFFQTSSLPRRMFKKFWFTEFRQADPVLFFLTFRLWNIFININNQSLAAVKFLFYTPTKFTAIRGRNMV